MISSSQSHVNPSGRSVVPGNEGSKRPGSWSRNPVRRRVPPAAAHPRPTDRHLHPREGEPSGRLPGSYSVSGPCLTGETVNALPTEAAPWRGRPYQGPSGWASGPSALRQTNAKVTSSTSGTTAGPMSIPLFPTRVALEPGDWPGSFVTATRESVLSRSLDSAMVVRPLHRRASTNDSVRLRHWNVVLRCGQETPSQLGASRRC